MSEGSPRWPIVVTGGIALLVGVLGGTWWGRSPGPSESPATTAASADHAPTTTAEHDHSSMPGDAQSQMREGDATVTLTPEVIARVGITTTAATAATSTMQLRLPGVVEPNSYKQVNVTSLVSGRITQVRAELGQAVMMNEVLATVFSPELAEAQTEFIAARSEHAAHDQRQARAQRLFAIGAVSRQELDRKSTRLNSSH